MNNDNPYSIEYIKTLTYRMIYDSLLRMVEWCVKGNNHHGACDVTVLEKGKRSNKVCWRFKE